MIRVEQRASTVLFKFLISNCKGYHFLIPANVCPVVALVLIKADVEFSFIDIDSDTHSGNESEYLSFLSSHNDKNIGLIYVNSYGCKHETAAFYQKIRQINSRVIIIEDNCLCIPVLNREDPVENVDLELFSTGYSKYVQLQNEGGYGIIRNELSYLDYKSDFNKNGYCEQQHQIVELQKTGGLFVYSENGWLPTNTCLSNHYTLKSYFDDINQQIALSESHKHEINALYDEFIPDTIKMGKEYSLWRYNLLLPTKETRDSIIDALFAEGLYCSAHYKSIASLFQNKFCKIAEDESNRIINLFNEIKYSKEMAIKTAKIVCSVCDKL